MNRKLGNLLVITTVLIGSLSIGACRVTPESEATAPQIIVPAKAGTYTNNSRFKVLIYCDGEVVDSLLPGQTKTLDLSHCETVGFTPVR